MSKQTTHPKQPKTARDAQFLAIARQVLSTHNITSDRAISHALDLHPDYINHVSNGHQSVSQTAWDTLFAKHPEARELVTTPTFETPQPTLTESAVRNNSPVFRQIINELDAERFDIPGSQPANSPLDFPAYLAAQLDHYLTYYRRSIRPHVDSVRKHGRMQATPLERIIVRLIEGINNAVACYYEGRLLRAAQTFQQALDAINISRLTSVETFPAGRTFYRTRHSSERHLTRKDLFHNPFENRGIVATNRYSIPGLPALYLGDSTYVCWEEYNRKDYRNLYFSRFVNTEPLKMVKIQRLPDLIAQLSADNISEERRMTILARYLSLFPLSIACSIRTRSLTDVFKPEYIVPQLLLQYVTDQEGKGASGIMYPSSKVDYTKIQGVPAYNYVFPVTQIQSRGYCSDLARIFALTAPTSTELETLTHFGNGIQEPLSFSEGLEALGLSGPRSITVAEDSTLYAATAFGYLERKLRSRPVEHIAASN